MSNDNKYNLNGLWKGFSTTSNETLTLSLFQGIASLVMFKKGTESRRPVVKMNLSIAACLQISDILKSLIDAQPDTRSPFVQMAFNKESRSYEQSTSFVFFKDEKRCYGVEISNKVLSTPVKIMFRMPSTFTTGSEQLSEEKKSVMAVRELIVILEDQIPTGMLLSRFNMEPQQYRQKQGGGGGGNNNYSRNRNSGSGSRDPYGGSEEGAVFD